MMVERRGEKIAAFVIILLLSWRQGEISVGRNLQKLPRG